MPEQKSPFHDLSNFQRWTLIKLNDTSYGDNASELIRNACMSAMTLDFTSSKGLKELGDLVRMKLIEIRKSDDNPKKSNYQITDEGSILALQVLNFVNNFISDKKSIDLIVKSENRLLVGAVHQVLMYEEKGQQRNFSDKYKSVTDIALKFIEGFTKLFNMAVTNYSTSNTPSV